MEINKLKLVNFRNHQTLELTFDHKTCLITGPNGSGKTNILEAIYFLSTGKSFRADYDRDLISHTAEYAAISADIVSHSDQLSAEVTLLKDPRTAHKSFKRAKINKVPKSIQYFTGLFNSVLFSPEQMELISGSPSGRRKYLDLVLSQTIPSYKKAHTDFGKCLLQRNKLLENIRETGQGKDQLNFWEEKLIENGSFVQLARQKFFDFNKEALKRYGKKLNKQSTELDVTYKCNKISKKRLEEHFEKELMAGTTLVGPHRDDFELIFDGYTISEFGSRGQQRSAILALKLGEIDFFTSETHARPLLLLDDIFSELDDKHRKAVLLTVESQQTIVTSTENFDLQHNYKHITL